ncbi:MAG: heparan-alpha-glucosaminide N-acetyltransferase [Rhodoferax sp.]
MTARNDGVDALRGLAVLWMTVFHFCFDLNHFGFIQQDFYRSPVWTVQRTCILSLFLLCAGMGQALAIHHGQDWARFWRRWRQVAACALLVSAGSAVMFPNSWIYFGVLHGMAAMLIVCRASAHGGRGLWLAGAMAVGLGLLAPWAHTVLPLPTALNDKTWNWLGLIGHKPITEDYVPLLPWMGVMWWGMAAGQLALARGWLRPPAGPSPAWRTPLAWIGRWSLSWYMVHQPVLIGVLGLVQVLRA